MAREQLKEISRKLNPIIKFLKQKKFQNIILVILFLILLLGSSSIRLSNLPLLKDSTTGKYIPLALDPFYFLRMSEIIVSEGKLPLVDNMRYIPLEVGFSKEILSQTIVHLYNLFNLFGDYSIQYVDVLSPVVFYILGLILFFFLIWSLTKNKFIALLSSGFLAFIPPYLYRTMAGFSDHESIGMVAFFATLLVFSLSLRYLQKVKKTNIRLIGFTLLLSFFSVLTIVSWGGIASFVFMIIPLTFLIIWFLSSKKRDLSKLKKILIFYIGWIIFILLFGPLFNYSPRLIMQGYMFSTSGILSLFLVGFFIVDYFLLLKEHKLKNNLLTKYRILFSGIITLFIGGILYSILIGNIGDLFSQILDKLLHPFGTSRIGLTVAENKQPYLIDWFNQLGKTIFWLFYLGMIFVGINLSKGIEGKKEKIVFSLIWIFFISSLLFSRISSDSSFNGENFISKTFYFLGAILFLIYCIKIYLTKKINISNQLVLIAAWLLPMIIAARGAIRLFFAIVPFICFMLGYLLLEIYKTIKRNKNESQKMFLIAILIVISILLIFNFINFGKEISYQAKHTGPSADSQWQNAMSWVRNNTNERDVFVHWWDYGYWVEYLGQRPSVTDGGHAKGYWDHLIGRYVLTTPYPETAFSFMKTQNVSYLLIDPSDIEKYPAYSKIGSDAEGEDRYSSIPLMIADPSQIQEKANSTIKIFQGLSPLDEDIIYEKEGGEIFLPKDKAAIIGIILETTNQGEIIQPQAIFIYQRNQIALPMKYVYYSDKLIDFGEGLEATISIIPYVYSSTQGYQADKSGALMYLSPKVIKGLFSQVYLLNNAFGTYNGLELVHSEDSPYFDSASLGDFIYFNGIQGPIKIYRVNSPTNTLAKEEFLSASGEYAELDNLKFTQ